MDKEVLILDKMCSHMYALKQLAILVEKLYLEFYAEDFYECDKSYTLGLLIGKIKYVYKRFKSLQIKNKDL